MKSDVKFNISRGCREKSETGRAGRHLHTQRNGLKSTARNENIHRSLLYRHPVHAENHLLGSAKWYKMSIQALMEIF